ncbi:putative oxidoreductase, aldo/keto reductase [Reticulomyxa filosa]|uniref:Putative oxidoreductase, aldo/keto reductase n=1 Tax=Reticulomyxa filosa TaxID=46433 RepID=X6MXP7_RETFI|nr:putative oxidoreductase, aldo/keto reductase [Reticulomyxa filosa]|eukprot:ETO18267.1 putative oxidoreductase, aldo/keto reductase [Reticulomyxa filosa]
MIQLLQQFPVKPQVVQNHMDLVDLEWEFRDFLAENHILLQAYGSFRGIAEAKEQEYNSWKHILLQMCEEIKQEQGIQVSPTQLVLRFLLENDVAVISRTSKSQHLKENNDIFTFEFTNEFNVQLGGQALLFLSQKKIEFQGKAQQKKIDCFSVFKFYF